MIVVYENIDGIKDLPDELLPEAVFRQSMAGQSFSFKGRQIPYISRDDFNALDEDIFVIIGCRSVDNIDKAIAHCKKQNYKYELISNLVFKPFTITAKEISERFNGEYKDAFNNVIYISPKKKSAKWEFKFSLKRTKGKYISNNYICIADDANIDSIKIEVGSSSNVIEIGPKVNIVDLTAEANNESKISIGKGCRIGSRCYITAGTEPIVYEDIDAEPETKSQTIEIGDRVYLRGGNFVAGNSVIPSGCVVGYNTPIEGMFTNENALIEGNPAEEKKHGINWK